MAMFLIRCEDSEMFVSFYQIGSTGEKCETCPEPEKAIHLVNWDEAKSFCDWLNVSFEPAVYLIKSLDDPHA